MLSHVHRSPSHKGRPQWPQWDHQGGRTLLSFGADAPPPKQHAQVTPWEDLHLHSECQSQAIHILQMQNVRIQHFTWLWQTLSEGWTPRWSCLWKGQLQKDLCGSFPLEWVEHLSGGISSKEATRYAVTLCAYCTVEVRTTVPYIAWRYRWIIRPKIGENGKDPSCITVPRLPHINNMRSSRIHYLFARALDNKHPSIHWRFVPQEPF